MMAFASLGSGSKGNSTLLRCGDALHLIDAGFSLRQIRARLSVLNVCPEDLTAIWVTHEHSDHISGLGPLARQAKCPVKLSAGTYRGLRDDQLPHFDIIDPDQSALRIDDVKVMPFTVPHDARQPCQYRFDYAGKRFSMLTDLGRVTPHVKAVVTDSDAMVLEFNHDPQLLEDGPYPLSLKRRIVQGWGHLSNALAAKFLQETTPLSHLRLGHLSASNNCPDLALSLAKRSAHLDCDVEVLRQDTPSDWVQIA